jgi:hypothetical protein
MIETACSMIFFEKITTCIFSLKEQIPGKAASPDLVKTRVKYAVI